MIETRPLLARFEGFVLDEGNARLARQGEPVELPPKAFAVLCELVRHGGRLVAKDVLLDTVWGHQHVSESVLKTTISQVRAALADDAKTPKFIETASRRGYRFIATIGSGTEAVPVMVGATNPAPGAYDTASPPPPLTAAGHLAPHASLAHGDLVGRDGEIAFLGRCLYLASAGARQVVLVAGEPGIGKTAVIERFVATRAGEPITIATGQCVEHFGSGEAYMPVLEALNGLCRDQRDHRDEGGSGLVALMRRVAPTWLVQLPWYVTDDDRQQLQREVAGATQDRMLREFGELIDRCTRAAPLVLVLEDLHWSDSATVQLIGYLARRRGPARLMLIGSFRPTEIIVTDHPLKGMRQELRLHKLCEELDLESFAESDVADYLAGRCDGQSFPEAFVRALHAHTEGLPLFLVNVVDELIAEGRLRREGDGWSVPPADGLGIPPNIVGVIEKQIRRLPDDVRDWLIAASVIGAEFVHTNLADALQVDADLLHDGLDRVTSRGDWLRAVGLVPLHDGRTGSRYAFRHALYRHVFYELAGTAQRMQLHRRVAGALIKCYCAGTAEIASELAMHFERGNDLPQAILYLQVAAAKALGRFAAREAVRVAQHALALLARLPDANERLDAELELRVIEGVALAQTHMYSEPEVAAAFERAQVLCDLLPESPARARALHGLWWVNFGRGDMQRALALARRIVALGDGTGDPNLRITGRIAVGSTLTHMGNLIEAEEQLRSGFEVFRADGERLNPSQFVQDPGVELLCYLALVQWWRGEPDRSRAAMASALARAATLNHALTSLMASHFEGVLQLLDGQYERALETSGAAIRIIVGQGIVGGGPTAHTWTHGCALVALGRVDEGLAEMRRGAEFCISRGMRLGMIGYYFLYSEACCLARRFDEAAETIEQGFRFADEGDERALVAPMHRIKATVLMAKGDLAGAQSEFEKALALARRQGARCFELGVLLSWSRLPQVSIVEAAKALRAAVDGYGAGDTVMLLAARTALAEWEKGRAPASD